MTHLPIEGGSVVAPVVPAWRRTAKRALQLFAAGVGVVVASLAGGTLVQSRPVLVIGMLVATVLFLLGVGWSVVVMVRIARSHDPGRAALGTAVALVSLVIGTLFSLFGAFIAFWATVGFARGRQLRRRGQILLPPVESGKGWAR